MDLGKLVITTGSVWGSGWMQGEVGGRPRVVPRLLILVIWQVVHLLMEVKNTGGEAGCLGERQGHVPVPPGCLGVSEVGAARAEGEGSHAVHHQQLEQHGGGSNGVDKAASGECFE